MHHSTPPLSPPPAHVPARVTQGTRTPHPKPTQLPFPLTGAARSLQLGQGLDGDRNTVAAETTRLVVAAGGAAVAWPLLLPSTARQPTPRGSAHAGLARGLPRQVQGLACMGVRVHACMHACACQARACRLHALTEAGCVQLMGGAAAGHWQAPPPHPAPPSLSPPRPHLSLSFPLRTIGCLRPGPDLPGSCCA